MNAYVDREICIGCGLCANTAPEVFRMDAENLAYAINPVCAGEEDNAAEAADDCPVGAITLEN